MIYVIADTNALLLPFQGRLNLDSELQRLLGNYELVVPKPIIGELERLKPRNKVAAPALKLARSRTIIQTESLGDEAVLELAHRLSGVIMTSDKRLIEEARKSGIRIIRLRGSGRLGFDGDIEPR
jgi:rRNA-processing protein FCF1